MSYDAIGLSGAVLQYALTIMMGGWALLIFLYLWRSGRLDMGEEAKHYVFEEESHEGKEHE